MNGASSAAMLARNASTRRARAGGHRLEQLPLGAPEPVAGAGQLLEQAAQRGREGRAGARRAWRPRGRARAGPRRAPRPTSARARCTCSGVIAVPHRPQARELVGLELAEAGEARAAGEGADADELGVLGAVGQPGEDLDQLELVVEVVLEPQDDRLERLDRGAQALVALPNMPLAGPPVLRPHPRSSSGGRSGTGPSCNASRHDSRSPAIPARSMVAVVESPLVTCSTRPP